VREITPTKRVSNLTFTLKNEIIELLESILERITKMNTENNEYFEELYADYMREEQEWEMEF